VGLAPKITVVVGPNTAGKTALLHGLRGARAKITTLYELLQTAGVQIAAVVWNRTISIRGRANCILCSPSTARYLIHMTSTVAFHSRGKNWSLLGAR